MRLDPAPRIAVWRLRIRAGRQPVVAVLVGLTLLVQAGDWWTLAPTAPVGTALAAGLTVAGAAAALRGGSRRGGLWQAVAVLLLGVSVVAGPWLTPPASWSSPWWPLTTASLLGCLVVIDRIGGRWSVLAGCLPVALAAVGLALTEPADGAFPIGTVVAQTAHHLGTIGVCAAVVWAVSNVADLVDHADLPGEAGRLAAARAAALRRIRPEVARQVHDRVLPVLQLVAMERADVSAVACREGARSLRRGSASEPAIVDLVSVVRALPSGAVRVQLRGAQAAIVPRLVGETLVAAVDEALRNVARHAGVTGAVVEIGSPLPLAAGVRVRVIDEGRGFDLADVPADRHGVVGSIGDRMRALGGSAAIASAPGRGTTVTLGWRPPPEPRTGTAPAALGPAGARRLLWPAAVHPAVNVVAVVATAGSLSHPGLGIGGAAGLLALVLFLVHRIPRRPLLGAGTASAALGMVVCVAAAGAAVPSGASDPSLFGTGSSAAAVVAVIGAVRPRRPALLTGLALMLTVLGVLVARFTPSPAWWVVLVAPLVGVGAGAVMGALIRRAGREVLAAGMLAGYRLSGTDSSALRRLVGELDPAAPALLDGLADGSIDPAAEAVRRAAVATEQRLREGLTFLHVPRTHQAVGAARDSGVPVVLHLAVGLGAEEDAALARLVDDATGRAAPGVRLTVSARRSGAGWRLSVLGAGPGDAVEHRVITLTPVGGSVHQPTWPGSSAGEGSGE
ncbi:hypothetical protein KVF89_16730 [Nocardioides carbamazepini]|uniref:sensor histidine kinase n=1 Tax=Nocardioides carbamazepini TaxID=2854259 RepID=UPI002149B1F1|nr:ATP-binding protein [Nocardioides carbamazepini]MCR1784188.1 hypothetical protein [Nocardioides carbamazepini]